MYEKTGYFATPLTTPEALGQHCAGESPGTLVTRNAVPPGILMVRQFLTPPQCAQVLEYAASSSAVPATVQDLAADGGDPRAHQSNIRVTDHIDTQGIDAWLQPLLSQTLSGMIGTHYQCEFEWFEKPALLRYTSGGHYVPHADADNWHDDEQQWRRGVDRDISILLYLDEKYDGGELDFPNFRFRFKPSAGMLICFPSDHRYVHAAREVRSGERHVIVSWAAKKNVPRIHAHAPVGAVLI
ncbi:MAG: prolyl hydroxylase family protein [Gammaproteobacteria bacterium]